MELTKNTDIILCQIYTEYLDRIKNDIAKSDAINFDAPEELVNDFLQGTLPEDVYDSVYELEDAGFVSTFIDASFTLNNSAIIYMENRFKKGLIEVTDFIAKFIP